MNYPKNRYSKNKERPWLDYDWFYDKYIRVKDDLRL